MARSNWGKKIQFHKMMIPWYYEWSSCQKVLYRLQMIKNETKIPKASLPLLRCLFCGDVRTYIQYVNITYTKYKLLLYNCSILTDMLSTCTMGWRQVCWSYIDLKITWGCFYVDPPEKVDLESIVCYWLIKKREAIIYRKYLIFFCYLVIPNRAKQICHLIT